MRLDKLLEDIYAGEINAPFEHIDVSSISCDSRKIVKGDMYVALKGAVYDGDDFIEDAVIKGASIVVISQDSKYSNTENADICYLTVKNTKSFLHKAVNRLYGNPSRQVATIGITGTNGKTTVAYLIEAILNEDQKACGVIGTVNYRSGRTTVSATQTTPDFVDNQKFLADLASQTIPYCVMEVSSHALTQDRVDGVNFAAAVFTNLTSDHLDYHKTREQYFLSKAQLFTALEAEAVAVINIDDVYGQKLCPMIKAKIVTYGIKQKADVTASEIQLNIARSCFTLANGDDKIKIQTQLIGTYNIYNILAAASVCLARGMGFKTVKRGIERLTSIPGRLEYVDRGQDFSIFIDYAHTEDALKNVLTAIRQVSDSKVILVFGCGGDRDMSKRCLMGRVASTLADHSIVTSDNPRSEDPQLIIDQIVEGFSGDYYEVIVNRREAIEQALEVAQTGDIVLIAGKGHETYQILGCERIDFNERKIIEECLSC